VINETPTRKIKKMLALTFHRLALHNLSFKLTSPMFLHVSQLTAVL